MNRRCVYPVNILGKLNKGPVEKHNHCALYMSDTLAKGLGCDYVWANYMIYIMSCSHGNIIPNQKQALEYILREIQNLTSARCRNQASIFLTNFINIKN